MKPFLPAVVRIGQELLDAEEDNPPSPRVPPETLRDRLSLPLGEEGLGEEAALEALREVVLSSPRTSDPRFVNQLFAGRVSVATAAEMLTALMNHSMYTFKAAGPQVLLEGEVIRTMCEKAGFPEGDGTLVPGGSISNLVGMLLGRNRAMPGIRESGGDGRAQRFYVSADGHYSVPKNAGMIGAGRDNVVRIPCDEVGRMRPEALDEAIAADRAAGRVPCAVVATSGTTVLGAFDPLREIAAVCRRHDVWLHVDGAFGGSMLLHPPSRHLFDGIEEADSLTWDAHKAMGVPLTCSLILTREPGLLGELLSEDADYLFQADTQDLNPGTKSPQCGRRNDALKLWATWKAFGEAGWAARLDRQFALARHAVERIEREPRLHLTQPPASLTICFEVEGMGAPEVCARLHEEGAALLGYGVVRGRKVVRLVTVNPDMREADLDRLFDDILALAAIPSVRV